MKTQLTTGQAIETFNRDGKTWASLDDLQAWSDNPRHIDNERLDDLVASIEDVRRIDPATKGQFKPVVITTTGIVVGGNMRLRAYQKCGISEIWVSVINTADPKEAFKIAIRDNERYGYYDEDKLVEIAAEYEIEPMDMELLQVDLGEVQSLADVVGGQPEPEAKEDEAPEVDETPAISKQGEIYQLGRHRLMCGSATETADVDTLLAGEKPDLIFTDPPYGIKVKMDNGSSEATRATIMGDDTTQVAVDALGVLTDLNAPIIYWGANHFVHDAQLPNASCWVVWNKQEGNHIDQADCELAWTNIPGPARLFSHLWAGFRRDSEVGVQRVHPTQKPVKLIADIFKVFRTGKLVLDVFGGSGSTLIACEQTDRTCYMMELDPKYVDVIRKRYAQQIGKEDQWQETTPAIKN